MVISRRCTVFAATLLAALSAWVVAACGGGSGTEPEELSFVRIATARLTPAPDAEYVARNESEWAGVWSSYHAGPNAVPARPAVDFAQRMVLGLSRQAGPQCGSLRIVRVADEAMRVRVSYATSAPPPGTACALVALPFADFVSVPRVNKQVVFVETPP